MRPYVLSVALCVLAAGCQTRVRDCMQALRDDPDARAVISLGPPLDALDRALPMRRAAEPDVMWLRRNLDELYEAGTPANRVLAYAGDKDRVQLFLALTDQRCQKPAAIVGSFWDRLLNRAQPRREREAILIYRCVPGSMPT